MNHILEISGRIYYLDKDRLPLFFYYQDKEKGWIYINHYRIWSLLESIFSVKDLEIKELLKVWLEDIYNLRGYTPTTVYGQQHLEGVGGHL